MSKEICGYKVFNEDWTCKEKQYACPGEFEEDGELELCKSGIHFCLKLKDCFHYYPFNPTEHVAKVVTCGNIIESLFDSKICTNKLKIVKEISFSEAVELLVEPYEKSLKRFQSLHTEMVSNEIYTLKQVIFLYKQAQLYEDKLISFINLINDSFPSIIDISTDVHVNLIPEANILRFTLTKCNFFLFRANLFSFFQTLEKREMYDVVSEFTNVLKIKYLSCVNQTT